MSVTRNPVRTGTAVAVAALALFAAGGFALPTPAGAVSRALISGSGSSWSANAVNQWVSDVKQDGLQVVYTAVGSAQGRKDFAYGTTDYAVSDIGYRGVDPKTNEQDTSQGRDFVYLPVVGGGTAFPYQVRVGGKLLRNLRLSGETLAKIFTLKITNWNDPQITADNNGRRLPSISIIPVVHSEGSGATAQFTRYLAKQFPSIWRSFSGYADFTEYFPQKGRIVAQNGSDGVMNFITSAAANGAIGYNEYSYALAKNYPVAKLKNRAGYFTAPTQYNVAVALTKAKINTNKDPSACKSLGYYPPCYLLQNLDAVYVYGDKRAYAMSSYSYMIIPTASQDVRVDTAKRQTLADFIYYAVCEGQAEMGPIGYSPLPINLVQASFDQVAKLKQADPKVDIERRNVSTCHNPTFVAGNPKRNYLAEIAPAPPACDKVGAGPCGDREGIVTGNPRGGRAPTVPGVSGGGATPTTGATAGPTVGGPTSGPTLRDTEILAEPIDLPGTRNGDGKSLATLLAAAELLLIIAIPPVLARVKRRGRSS